MTSESYYLYGGEVTLIFEPGRHSYSAEVDGKVFKKIPSVTGITGVLNKPALVFWAAEIGAEAAEGLLIPGMKIDELNRAEIVQAIKAAHWIRRDTTADVGTAVHEWIESYIDASFGLCEAPVPAENEHIRNSIDQFLEWETKNDVEWLVSEQKVYSRKDNYAGTLDAEAMVRGKFSLVDLKTGSGIYPEMYMQVAAYARAREEEDGRKHDQLCILRIPRDGDSFETAESTKISKHFQGFLGCRKAFLWQKEMGK